MTTTKNQEPDERERIARLEEQLERLNAAEDEKQREKAARESLAVPAPPRPTQLSQGIAAVQDRALEQRRRAHAEQNAAYEEQLERTAPEREKLELQLAELAGSLAEINERHAAAVARVTAAQQVVRGKLTKLSEMPPMRAVPGLARPVRRRRFALGDLSIAATEAGSRP
jgi:hypothetical protein